MFRPWRSLMFLVVLTSSGLLGRLTVIESAGLAIIWPAGGVAALWMMWSTWRQRVPDLILLGLAIFGLNYATGASVGLATLFVVVNCVQAAVFVMLLERWCPRLDGAGGDQPLSTTGNLLRFTAAGAAAAAVTVLIGWVGLTLVASAPTGLLILLWWGRQLAGLLVFALTWQLIWGSWRERTLLVRRNHRAVWASCAETALLAVASTALYLTVFVQSSLPLAFMPAVVSVWAGLRLTPAWTAAHGAMGSLAVIVFTVQGTGPFALAQGAVAQASMAQLLIAVLMFTGLSLSVAVHTNETTVAALEAEQERARDNARTAQAQADLLIAINQTMDDALIVFDDEGNLLTANPAAESLLATTGVRRERAGTPDGDEDELSWHRIARLAVGGHLSGPVDLVVNDTDHQQRTMSSVARGLPGGGAVLVLSDVTADRRRTDELASFAAVVAHDLRNPIGVVRGWTDELSAQIDEGVPARDLLPIGTAIDAAAVRMEDLISDLLTHATSRDRSLETERVQIDEMVDEIASARGIAGMVVATRFDSVAADRAMLRQLLDNLIGNAVKYVAPGVEPRVEVTGITDEQEQMVTVSLVDNGIGVPADETDRIFQQFQRAHRVGYQGTGLGLAICRTIVERHGGEIGVEPGPAGVGSRFWFTMPAAERLEIPSQPSDRAPSARLAGADVA